MFVLQMRMGMARATFALGVQDEATDLANMTPDMIAQIAEAYDLSEATERHLNNNRPKQWPIFAPKIAFAELNLLRRAPEFASNWKMVSAYLTTLAAMAALVVGYCVWRSIDSARTPQGAAAWAVFLVSAPWFAVPAFLLFGQRKVAGYRATWRESHAVTQDFEAFRRHHIFASGRAKPLKAIEEIGGLPFIGGNDFELLVDGEETFDAICAAIDGAQRYVCIQFYIIRDDKLGRRFSDCLIAVAKRGVMVRVMYDGVGSYFLRSSWPRRLRKAGIKVLDPRISRGPSAPWHLNFRNHRKTVIVDGHAAFVGGHNIGDEYLGLNPELGHWRDTHLAMYGPVVSQAQLIFAEDWNWVCGENLENELDWSPDPIEMTDLAAAMVPTGPGDKLDSGALMFFSAITGAEDRVWIASPYFVPDTDIQSALITAALAGRDVRLILPETIEHYLPWLAAHAFFDEMVQAGVKIFCYQDGFMHQKVILIDDDLAAVGTANLDNRSFRLNFETMVFVEGKDFAMRVETMLRTDLEHSAELQKTLQEMPRWIRIGAPIARLLAPIL